MTHVVITRECIPHSRVALSGLMKQGFGAFITWILESIRSEQEKN